MKRLFQHITLILTMALVAVACSDDTSNGEGTSPMATASFPSR